MSQSSPSHRRAVFQALLVTFLWSTSWVLIKIGLQDIPALTFAGLRYCLAFICLLPFALRPRLRQEWRNLTASDWLRLLGLGLLFYAVTQGGQFIGLAYLPAITVSLLLNFTALLVAVLGIALLNERPNRLQWLGTGLFLAGVFTYFYPVDFPRAQWLALAAVIAGVIANALSAILGRHLNRGSRLDPLMVTAASMGFGAILLLWCGIAVQGLPHLKLVHWSIIAWLALVNTAFAFTLWNRTLQVLSAVESSIINGTMLIQIAVLAWIFLGEALTWQKAAGMLLAGAGAVIVQLRRATQSSAHEQALLLSDPLNSTQQRVE